MAYPARMKAEFVKGVVCEELRLCDCYTDTDSWRPGRREIYTCPVNYPKDALKLPYQARMMYDYLEPGPKFELFEAGAYLLDRLVQAFPENLMAFKFSYDYSHRRILLRVGPPGEGNDPYVNLSRETEVFVWLDIRRDGTLRAQFVGKPPKCNISSVYGSLEQIAKRFLFQIEKVALPYI